MNTSPGLIASSGSRPRSRSAASISPGIGSIDPICIGVVSLSQISRPSSVNSPAPRSSLSRISEEYDDRMSL
jgi:hypothetical protein